MTLAFMADAERIGSHLCGFCFGGKKAVGLDPCGVAFMAEVGLSCLCNVKGAIVANC